ncbi:TIGR03915 family putative DNA repair protein [Flavobacterium foetidum]|uniref:TIGR03915 family putative DNA repair protein n=1 Tax=Flavobacterium foetidum TaxID=2026681 RepID=UPI0010757541|nr:TIGR03915 family putative DNA repair protein [Flavobacterium foetidum]KAF2514258.1 DNA metabolism protein [Flavobacterium foetidum]
MTQVIYDGTYEGWLTAVFEIYEYKLNDIVLAQNEALNTMLFADIHTVTTDISKAERVENGLRKRLTVLGFQSVFGAFQSEINKIDEVLFRFVKHVLSSDVNVEGDLGNDDVLAVKKAFHFTTRESHRMKAFIRFKLTKDNLYYAIIEPDCDVLPLIEQHFKKRYADQRWLIYDAKRKYGIYYDLENTSVVALQFDSGVSLSKSSAEFFDEDEGFFQDLWRCYFSSVNIASRKNTKLHLQHMPKRYWKHLTEKRPDLNDFK